MNYDIEITSDLSLRLKLNKNCKNAWNVGVHGGRVMGYFK